MRKLLAARREERGKAGSARIVGDDDRNDCGGPGRRHRTIGIDTGDRGRYTGTKCTPLFPYVFKQDAGWCARRRWNIRWGDWL